MKFQEIPGLDSLKQQLIGAYEKNHIAHAQLFNSQEGGAGLPMALAYSTFLLCENKKENDSCGECPSCQKMDKFIHPDLHLFFPKPSKENKKEGEENKTIANFREFLLEQPFGNLSDWIIKADTESKQNQISKDDALRIIKTVSLKSFEGGLKILIIWYPELMNISSSNAILKVLEEPPTETIYLLVTYSYESLLSTILSRTQHILIPTLSPENVSSYLSKNNGISHDQAIRAAKLSNGSISEAMKYLNEDNTSLHLEFQDWMRDCFKGQYGELIKRSEAFHGWGKNTQRNFINYSILQTRNSLVYQATPEIVALNDEEISFTENFGNSLSADKIEVLYKELNQTLMHLERNANPKITFLALSNRIAGVFRSN